MYYLEAKDIVKQYGDYTALSGVNISVSEGKIYGLLGPNGAGKTSLIRIINRIAIADSGQVLIKGRESVAEDVFNIGYMPEERGLYKKMKVGEQIIFLARLRGLPKTEAIERTQFWLDKFKIKDWENKKVSDLSKGMQQKIQFIATVIHNPDLLILDEPFSGLDPVNADILKTEILELKDKDKTIILSTHNMGSVEELCDEITLINKSKVVLQGNVNEIKGRFRAQRYMLVIAGTDIDLQSDLFSVESVETGADRTKVIIHKTDSETSNSKLVNDIIQKHELLSFEEQLPTMNDIFIQIVSNSTV